MHNVFERRTKMLKKSLATAMFIMSAGFYSCQKWPEHMPPPDCSKVLQTKGEQYIRGKYGEYHFADLGLGLFQIGTGEYLLDLIDRSGQPPLGFEFYANQKGGIGNALDLEGCVFMQYIGGGLNSIANRGATITDTSLHVGSTLDEFIEKYPNARPRKMRSHTYQEGELWTSGHFKVNISIDGRIRMMEVGAHNYDEDDEDEESWPIGPQYGPRPWY